MVKGGDDRQLSRRSSQARIYRVIEEVPDKLERGLQMEVNRTGWMQKTLTPIFAVMFLSSSIVTVFGADEPAAGQWPAKKAWQWYMDVGVIKGCNYLPRSATNTTEMWQAETFDPETIDQELGWAQQMNYNSMRVFLQYLVWEDDPAGFFKRVDRYLEIADRHGISTMFVLFDDCAFGYPAKTDPYLGKQGDPEPGEYAPYWTPSPGHSRVRDTSKWPKLEEYVKSIITRYANDKRVLIWDLYNEPGSGVGEASRPLVQKIFEWARKAKPSQPLTVCWWEHALCDVITFHDYSNATSTRAQILKLQDYGRPIINTEWLIRRNGNTVKDILPVFENLCVGWYHWGLVAGRTQTFMHWTSKKGDPIPENWQHDIFYPDGKPYRPAENELLKEFTFERWKVQSAAKRWSAAKARQWYEKRDWPIGCNFLPSTAVNSTEMWQAESFDPTTIDKELGWAEDIGFNSIRVFVQYLVWEDDPEGLKKRMEKLLEIAESHGISVMFILFDDCFKPEPYLGKQDDPIPGVHNSQWTSSPGEKRKKSKDWSKLEQYVRDVVGHFADDDRIIVWDLYNEPQGGTRPLVEKTFAWARMENASQPLTTCSSAEDLCDVVSYHAYGPAVLEDYAKYGGSTCPAICTEWMARTAGSRFETHLPLFKKYKIGCYSWGLVAGRTQTYLPYSSKEGDPEPTLWFHDIFRQDGTPYDPEEIEFIKHIPEYVEGNVKARDVVETSFDQPKTWRYTTDKPADDWMKPAFDDSQWKTGPGGFGISDLPTRRARTEWKTPDIWLRRTIDIKDTDFEQLALKIHYDENPQVYFNGVLISELYGFNASYILVKLGDRAAKAIKKGKNVLAVHASQTGGGQYIDVGLAAIVNVTEK